MPYEKKAVAKKSSGKAQASANKFNPIKKGADNRGQMGGNGDGEKGPQFLKIDPNSYVDVAILVDPDEIISVEQCSIWLNVGANPGVTVKSPSWVYIGEDDPFHQLSEWDSGIQRRYRAYLPVLDPSTGESKIWAMSKTQHNNLLDLADANGDSLKGINIRIKRTGSQMQTRYNVVPRGSRMDVDDVEEVDVVAALGPLDLDAIEKMIAQRLNCEDFAEVLEKYQGKKIASPQPAVAKSKAKAAVKKARPVDDDDEDEDEDLEDVELR